MNSDKELSDEYQVERNKLVYHITPSINIASILSIGLIPKIGERSKLINETLPAIYFFPTINDVENALYNWLGEIFEDESELALLQVEINNYSQLVEWELISFIPIPSKNIKVIDINVDNIDLNILSDYL